jgi:hypothetical protein
MNRCCKVALTAVILSWLAGHATAQIPIASSYRTIRAPDVVRTSATETAPPPFIPPKEASPPPSNAPASPPPPMLGPDFWGFDGSGEPCDSWTTPLCPRAWISVEYLNWWITRGPVRVPLVTTGDPTSPTGGFIGDPSTVVLFGNSDVKYGTLSGGRLSMGRWFGDDCTCGMEGSAFFLGKRTKTFSAASDAAGNPLLVIPFQTPAGVESGFVISSPTVPQTGSVNIASTTQLCGADVNGVWNVCRDCCRSFDVLLGFRYLDLQESLDINANTNATPRPVTIFAGDFKFLVTSTTQATVFDSFKTRNQFYGGQIGARATYRCNCWSLQFLGELAVGSTVHKQTNAGGFNSSTNGTVVKSTRNGAFVSSTNFSTSTSTAGGIFTNQNNLGEFESSSFSVVPSLQVKLGYDITPHVTFTLGYDALLWTSVERPGDQINHQQGSGPLHNRSSVWVQGIDAGLLVHW